MKMSTHSHPLARSITVKQPQVPSGPTVPPTCHEGVRRWAVRSVRPRHIPDTRIRAVRPTGGEHAAIKEVKARGQDGSVRRACSVAPPYGSGTSMARHWMGVPHRGDDVPCCVPAPRTPAHVHRDVPAGEDWWGAVRTPGAAAAPPGARTPLAEPTAGWRQAPYSPAHALMTADGPPSGQRVRRFSGITHTSPHTPLSQTAYAPSLALPQHAGRAGGSHTDGAPSRRLATTGGTCARHLGTRYGVR